MAVNKKKITLILLSVVLIGLVAFYYGSKYSAEKNKEKIIEEMGSTTEEAVTVSENEKEDVVIYIYDNLKNGLIKKRESIEKAPNSHEKIKAVFELLKTKSGETFDQNAKILNVYFEDGGKVYVNFNRDFINPSFSNDVKISTLYSFVNTVCSMGYSKVKIMIENEDVATVGQGINAGDFFEKDALLIKGE